MQLNKTACDEIGWDYECLHVTSSHQKQRVLGGGEPDLRIVVPMLFGIAQTNTDPQSFLIIIFLIIFCVQLDPYLLL